MISCKDDCDFDPEFERFYFLAIKSIRSEYLENKIESKGVSPQNARLFLNTMTEVKSSISKGHFGEIYLDYEAFEADQRKWEKWYQENRCTFKSKTADSLYVNFINSRARLDLPDSIRAEMISYPEDWRNLFE